MLVHSTFNVSIPRHHIPTDSYEYEHGPAENDPEFGDTVQVLDAVPETPGVPQTQTQAGEEQAMEGEEEEETDILRGKWVHKMSGDVLGGQDRILEFTVVGYVSSFLSHMQYIRFHSYSKNSMTIANQMLSLIGSIQLDPFDPTHVPQPQLLKQREEETQQVNENDDEDMEEARILVEESDDEPLDGDDLEALGRKTDRVMRLPVVGSGGGTAIKVPTLAPPSRDEIEDYDDDEKPLIPPPAKPSKKHKERDRDKDKVKEEKKRKRRESKSGGDLEEVVKPSKKNKKDS